MRCQHFKRTPVRLGAFMRKRCATNIWLTFALLILGLCGCDKSTQPLPLLAAEQIPTELQKAFRKAKPELNNVVAQINSELQSKDYASAYQGLQFLTSVPDITEEQRTLAARALLSINGLLQTAQAQGDQKAAEVLKFQQRNR